MERSTAGIIFVLLSLLSSSTDAGFGVKSPERKRRDDPNKDWSYSGETGPAYWVKLGYKACGGKRQSPIVLKQCSAVVKLAEKNLKCVGCDVVRSGMSLENDGKTVLLKLSGNLPYLEGPRLYGNYTFEHIDFHFGKDKNSNAGHVLPFQGKMGKKNNLEMHAMFKNPEGKMAILAFLFQEEETEETENFKPILKYLDNILYKGTKTSINKSFSLKSLIRNIKQIYEGQYFRYMGSRTKPPCTEGVTWFVYNTIDGVSKELMDKFRSLFSTTEGSTKPKPLYGNVRPPQARNGRYIFFIGFNKNA